MKTNRVSDDIIELLLTSLSVIVIWNRLNVYAFSKFISWSPNIQCDGTWRWGLCYIIQFRWDHEGGTTWWDQCPYNNGEEKKPECSLLAMWGHKEKAAFCKSGRSPDQESNLPAPIILDFPASRTMRIKCLLFKTRCLCYCYISPSRLMHRVKVRLKSPYLLFIEEPVGKWYIGYLGFTLKY